MTDYDLWKTTDPSLDYEDEMECEGCGWHVSKCVCDDDRDYDCDEDIDDYCWPE